MARLRQHSFFEPDRPMVIAHRGGSGLAPENTLAAFDRAVELGVHALELDVHLTRDEQLVVCHDPTIDRTTDGSGAISRLSLEQLGSFDAGHAFTPDGGRSFPFRGRGLRLPSLRTVLARHPTQRFSIELKDASAEAAIALLGILEDPESRARICVGSFHDRPVRYLREAAPDLATHATASEVRRRLLLGRLGLGWLSAPSAHVFTVPETAGRRRIVTPRLIRALGRRGVDVHVWCVDDARDMRRLVSWGARGIITSRPDRALELLA